MIKYLFSSHLDYSSPSFIWSLPCNEDWKPVFIYSSSFNKDDFMRASCTKKQKKIGINI
jgi:hypothetical protein